MSQVTVLPLVKPPADSTKIHMIPLEEFYLTVQTTFNGLDSEAVKRKTEEGGLNQLTPPRTNNIMKMLNYIFGGFNTLMWVAAILSFISYKPLGGAVISLGVAVLLIIVIVVSAFFYAYVDWNASKIMKSIRSLVAEQALVIRDGKEQRIDSKNIVVGDVVLLTMGQRVPADIRLIEISADLKFDKALLTGESDLISGTIEPTDETPLESKNLAFSSTFVAQGRARGIVYEIGDNTVMGNIVKLAGKKRTALTHIQKGLNAFTLIISVVATSFFCIAVLLWGVWLKTDYPNYENAASAINNALGCLTAFIPQGLPVCFALALTIIARRMAARKVLVKNLASIETLGCMSVLCSDKTGTLTMGKMFVQATTFFDRAVQQADVQDAKIREVPAFKDSCMISARCNDAFFLLDDTTAHLPISERPVSGDSTDAAILRYSEYLRSFYPKLETPIVEFSLAFNSKNKFMAKLLRVENNALQLLVKGAPDILIHSCTKALQSDGTTVSIASSENFAKVTKLIEDASSQGFRVLALCQKNLPDVKELPTQNQDEMEKFVISQINDLTLVSLLSICDPPRSDTHDTVKIIRGGGVRVFMVTGDAELTALAIARQVGIITADAPSRLIHVRQEIEGKPLKIRKQDMRPNEGDPIRAIAITGKDLMTMTNEEWDYCATTFTEMVFARTTPEQKVQIVENLKKRGDNIVAVTGDGTNDAPALKVSDIGVAMGSGTDVAKEAATMILLNNDFASLVVGIENGRLVFENIKKVMFIVMPAGTYAEFMAVLANVVFGMQLALSSFEQVLFSVANDICLAVALMYEKSESDLMRRPPRRPRVNKLCDWQFFFQIYLVIGPGIWLSAMGMWFLYWHTQGLGFYDLMLVYDKWQDGWAGQSLDELNANINVGQCVYYVTLAIMQIGTLLAIRNRRVSILSSNPLWGPRQNLAIPVCICITLLICVICLYGPALQGTFGTSPIPVQYWFIPFTLAFGNICIDEIRKFFLRKYPKSIVGKCAW